MNFTNCIVPCAAPVGCCSRACILRFLTGYHKVQAGWGATGQASGAPPGPPCRAVHPSPHRRGHGQQQETWTVRGKAAGEHEWTTLAGVVGILLLTLLPTPWQPHTEWLICTNMLSIPLLPRSHYSMKTGWQNIIGFSCCTFQHCHALPSSPPTVIWHGKSILIWPSLAVPGCNVIDRLSFTCSLSMTFNSNVA